MDLKEPSEILIPLRRYLDQRILAASTRLQAAALKSTDAAVAAEAKLIQELQNLRGELDREA